jgi:hypothetical protein
VRCQPADFDLANGGNVVKGNVPGIARIAVLAANGSKGSDARNEVAEGMSLKRSVSSIAGIASIAG